jgi:putative acetyltransferase
MIESRNIMICRERPDNDDARRLIHELDEEILRRYPALEKTHGLHPQDFSDPSFTFLVARLDGRPVGCGALRGLERGVGEVKRMFVVPEFRGLGIARRILKALESRARELDYSIVRLETGDQQPEAVRLYKSSGYSEIAAYGEYVGNTFSICFEKRLSKVSVRKAAVEDARQVACVMNSVIAEGSYTIFDTPFSEDDERRFISSLGQRSALHVAEVHGEIAGVQSIDLFANFAESVRHVATMGTWLLSNFRGHGIGRLLAEQSFAFARSSGYTKVVIQVLAGNDRALRFYRGLGFNDIGIARQHVRLAGEFHDEVYLEKLL